MPVGREAEEAAGADAALHFASACPTGQSLTAEPFVHVPVGEGRAGGPASQPEPVQRVSSMQPRPPGCHKSDAQPCSPSSTPPCLPLGHSASQVPQARAVMRRGIRQGPAGMGQPAGCNQADAAPRDLGGGAAGLLPRVLEPHLCRPALPSRHVCPFACLSSIRAVDPLSCGPTLGH